MWYRKKTELPEVNPVLKYVLFLFSMLYWVCICHTFLYSILFSFSLRILIDIKICQKKPEKLFGLGLILIGTYAIAEKGLVIEDFSNLITDPANIILCIGAGIFFLTFFACVGALRENICMLNFFSLVLTASLVVQIVSGLVIVLLSDQVEKYVEDYFSIMIETYRDDIDRQNIIDWGQEEFKCCGTYDYNDWTDNIYFNCSETNPSFERCSVPWSCCIVNETDAIVNTLCGIGALNLDFIAAREIIYVKGCIPTMILWIHDHIMLLACLALGVVMPQIIGVLISRMLLLQIKDQDFYIKLQEIRGRSQFLPRATTTT